MAIDLGQPYDDETLYSVIGRYLQALKVGRPATLLRILFGRRPALPYLLAYSLDQLAIQCRFAWGWSGADIAERLTAYPYIAALLSAPRARALRNELKGRFDAEGRRNRSFGPHVRRLCEACYAEDRLCGRTPYWRRTHQLPGVVVCPQHNRWLLETREEGARFLRPWTIPEQAIGAMSVIKLSHTKSQREAYLTVSRVSQWLLNSGVQVNVLNLNEHFRERARSAGYAHGPTHLLSKQLARDFVAFYGTCYLCHVNALPDQRHNWIAEGVREGFPSTSASKALLLGLFLGSLDVRNQGAWPNCPNQLVHTEGPHPVELRRRQGDKYLAKCSCGFGFSYRAVRNGMPLDVKATQFGPSHVVMARRLRCEGLSMKAIGKVMGVDPNTARRLIDGQCTMSRPVLTDRGRNELFEQWQRIQGAPRPGRKLNQEYAAVYLQMRRYGREHL